ncbi:cyanamide hydratase [Dermatophagoides farinae]|uniref:Cyanamide hydratase n=1 Tax=Dermatophagoides farinae TaxID=6954 RepID=A0A922I0T0_DERFA|nr:protein DDI1 homolog 2-like [Dermatophagoides farinae]KAH7646799.1 rings lost / dna-damage inducible protein ddi1-like protein [Dermatophagoides farinae]KAH9517399.1 cyanamide hydratase [Dermatophagoides farinae]
MKLTITTLTDLIIHLDVSGDMELENFKALCSLETNIDSMNMSIFFNGKLLQESNKTLSFYGVQDGDMLLVKDGRGGGGGQTMMNNAGFLGQQQQQQQQLPQLDFSSIQVPNHLVQNERREAENIFATLRSNPEQVATLRVNNPRLAEAFDKGIEEFAKTLRIQQEARAKEDQRRIRMLLADPFDSEAQRMIAEEIRRQQIDSNMETAMEYLPESFAEVAMLYINCKVNGFPIKAFVDSGAQSTIMSKACAERCNILRLIDNRWSGIARGVGTQRILGKIHLVQLEINGVFVPCSFTILEHQPMDMLLGLDMLRRYQCSIDLKSNVLRIGTTGTETPFLSESEIPKFARLNMNEDLAQDDVQKAIQESLKESSPMTNSSGGSAQTPSTSGHQSRSGSNSSTGSRHSEADIQELVSMGFKREQVIIELDTFNGDKNQAIAALFAKSIIVPDNLK